MNLGICEYCEKSFNIPPTRPFQKCCSRICGNLNKKKNITIRPYSLEIECKCGCGKKFLTPDDHYRIKQFIKNHQTSNGNHPRLGYKEPEVHIEYRMKQIHKHFKENYTCIEKELYFYLEKIGIKFEKQKQIGRTRPDAFIPSLNLCVYADGNYWHNKKENKERDKRCNKSLMDKGFLVMRLNSISNGYKLGLRPLQQYLLQNNKYI